MRRQGGKDKAIKRAPGGFDDEDDNIGDVEEKTLSQNRGVGNGNYNTADT
jgi:hypothetical protein